MFTVHSRSKRISISMATRSFFFNSAFDVYIGNSRRLKQVWALLGTFYVLVLLLRLWTARCFQSGSAAPRTPRLERGWNPCKIAAVAPALLYQILVQLPRTISMYCWAASFFVNCGLFPVFNIFCRIHQQLHLDLSHLNRTDSSHSNNVRSASNMIPCFPANNSTDVHHCDIVSSHSSPSHSTKDTPFNTSQVRTRSTTKKLNHCLENQKGHYLRNRNTGECSCCNSSQDD